MIYAKEAHKIAEENDTTESLREVVERVIPTFDKAVRRACEMGSKGIMVKKEIISKAAGFTFWANRNIMDAVRDELESYGYTVSIPESYTSIHVNW